MILRIDLDKVNCYLAKTENGFILFDTGGHIVTDKEFDNRREALEKALEEAGCTPENLKLIVLTHGDNDHVCNASYLRKKYHAKIALHKNDVKLVENPDMENFMASFQYQSFIYKIVFKILNKTIRKVGLKTLKDFETFTPDILMDETFDFLNTGFDGKVLHLPGHTMGSVGILTPEGELIAGDTLANSGKPGPAVNALDFLALNKSIQRLKGKKIKTVYPGHGTPFCFDEIK